MSEKQRAYEARRREVTGLAAVPMVEYRIIFRDGTEKTERAIGLSQIAACYPEAVQVSRCDWTGFW